MSRIPITFRNLRTIFTNAIVMTGASTSASDDAKHKDIRQKARSVVPKLTGDLHKGESGRICVVGGSFAYTGAPYFAAISALKTGADVVHVICEKEAGQVIKSYSPELIVHAVLDAEKGLQEIDEWLPKFHAVVLGPGLGKNKSTSERVSAIIERVKAAKMPLVIDADGLLYVTKDPSVIKGYTKAVLTPNAMEFTRLVKSLLKRDVSPNNNPSAELVSEVAKFLGGVTIVHKGSVDVISDGNFTEKCADEGSPRRCGGQGDLLSGSLAVFMHWCTRQKTDCPDPGAGVIAGWAATSLTRACAAKAFSQHGRATTTSNLIDQIEKVFQSLFESEETDK